MTRSFALFALGVSASCLLLGCTGSSGGGGNGKQDGDDGPDDIVPVDELELNRNPDHPLACTDPQKPITGRTPLVRLSSQEYTNTLRDLLAPLTMQAAPALPGDTLRPGFAPDDALSASNDLVEGQSSGASDLGSLVAAGLGELGIDGCPPADADGERRCLDAFIDAFVMRAYRRPAADDEREAIAALYTDARAQGSFAEALATVVEGVLQTPQFLYRLELGETPDDGRAKLTGYEMAARLSYLLWDTMPDADLFGAAAAGELDTADGVRAQVRRMLNDERAGRLAYDFADAWLELELRLPRAAAAAKDKATFPGYSEAAARGLIEGLEHFLADSLAGDGGGIRKLLTSRAAWVNEATAAIHGVDASGSELQRVELDGARRQGLLTQPALMAALANPQKHAPVRRGMLVLDRVLCQPPPPPPDGMVPPQPEPDTSVERTTRERLVIEHEGQGGACKSCHQLIDNVGFAFEHYDAVGAWQDDEDGLAIDASAEIVNSYDADGRFDDAVPMIATLAKSEQVAQCYVETFYRYALAREVASEDGCNVARLTDRVLDSDADFLSLLEGVATTPAFRYRSAFAR